MLAGGALGGAAAAAAGAPFPVQAIVAAVVAVTLLIGVRPLVKKRFTTTRNRPLLGMAAHVGRIAVVLETVTSTDGRVSISGETWSARSTGGDALLPGERVEVLKIDGATAVVAPSSPAGLA
ncbi:MAG: NfeD family protein [Actinomycetales bacterium]|nr:NfeD family protein [Actinomycetales bacterium]